MRTPDQVLLRALLATADGDGPPLVPGLATLLERPGPADAHIVAMARHHRLSPLLSATARPGEFTAAVAQIFRRDRMTTLGRSTLHRHALTEILEAFDAERTEVSVLKGIAYDELIYQAHPGSRPASDIDILVRMPERQRSIEVLHGMGYWACASAPGFDEPDSHEVSFRRGDVNVDVHFALAPLVRCRVDYDALWSQMQTWNFSGRPTQTLDFTSAALNQAVHMAIHHFDVPALYAIDFRRLVERAGRGDSQLGLDRVTALASQWRCLRPLETAVALAGDLLPGAHVFAPGAHASPPGARLPGPARVPAAATSMPSPSPSPSPFARRVVRNFGGLTPVPRAEQLARKLAHFDDPRTALRYAWVQGRRVLREHWINAKGHRLSPAQRLGLQEPAGGRR